MIATLTRKGHSLTKVCRGTAQGEGRDLFPIQACDPGSIAGFI